MNVLIFETCWAVNSEIIKQVISSWSIFIQRAFIIFSLPFIFLVLFWRNLKTNHSTVQGKPVTVLYVMYTLWPNIFQFPHVSPSGVTLTTYRTIDLLASVFYKIWGSHRSVPDLSDLLCWRHVDWQIDTQVSKEHGTFIFGDQQFWNDV